MYWQTYIHAIIYLYRREKILKEVKMHYSVCEFKTIIFGDKSNIFSYS